MQAQPTPVAVPAAFAVEQISFESDGTLCRGDLFLPAVREVPVPCVVMAHGFGLTKDSGLVPFARGFAEAGYAVVLFDYRGFGQSEGEPRRVLRVRRQLGDWHAALAFARGRAEIDPSRIATWGTSLSAGHALTCAAQDGRVSAVVAQNPMLNGLNSTLAAIKHWSVLNALRLVGRGILDVLRSALGGRPVYVPMSAPPGQLGLLTSPDAYVGYQSVTPAGLDYSLAARIGLVFWTYWPQRHLRKLRAPLLLMPCTVDRITPVEQGLRAAQRYPNARSVEFDCHHFEIYLPPHRARALDSAVQFLRGCWGQ